MCGVSVVVLAVMLAVCGCVVRVSHQKNPHKYEVNQAPSSREQRDQPPTPHPAHAHTKKKPPTHTELRTPHKIRRGLVELGVGSAMISHSHTAAAQKDLHATPTKHFFHSQRTEEGGKISPQRLKGAVRTYVAPE